MSKYALFEQSIPYSPQLGYAYGICGALLIQQIHFWCEVNRKKGQNFNSGHYWCYNTYKQWEDQFMCFDARTIRRALDSLVLSGVIIKGRFNKSKYDKTNWYRINRNLIELQLAALKKPLDILTSPTVQIDPTPLSKLAGPIPETLTETKKNLPPLQTKPAGKITIMKVPQSSAMAILKQHQVNTGKVPLIPPNTIGSLISIWQRTVPKHHESIKLVPSFTLAEKGMFGKVTKSWGNASDPTMIFIIENWIGFCNFVEEQAGVKKTPIAPALPFLLKYATMARNYMLTSVQLAAPKKAKITFKKTEPIPVVASQAPEAETAPANIDHILAWKDK